MAPKPELPSVPTLLKLAVEYEMNDEQIAARYGVSRQAVHKKLKPFRGPRANAARHSLPWELSNDHRQGWLYERVLLLMRSASPAALNERQHQRLASLLDVLERLETTVGVPHVIDYEQESDHGLYLRPIRPTDDPDSLLAKAVNDAAE